MQQYFVPANQFKATGVVITGDDAKHIQRVIRMDISDPLICANNKGDAFLCQVEAFENQSVRARIISRLDSDPELPIRITIAQGIPKGDKFDTIVQKGTECGAKAFIPFQAERSVSVWHETKLEKKRTRLRKIAKEAAEQSHRLFIPDVEKPMTLEHLLSYSHSFTFKAVAYEETAKNGHQSGFPSLLQVMKKGDSLLAVIGPEGGLSPREAERFRQSGFFLCGLGPRILRTETASLYLLSAASYHFELLSKR
ncbi:16S rRNA (uracil(1498)-N(3))-methyltransferase [Sporolactobacillus sp. THM7-4]|nr:16S rRNA (uracil(1498)-N(3))-methyltransferase [Sporolactobacillus sp. THM7-4]